MIPYIPKRDYRFEYLWDVMSFIEENKCHDCAFKSDRPDYPMCFEIEAEIIDEKPVAALDDQGDDGVVCTRYRNEVLVEQEHPDQLRLFGVDSLG